MNIYATLPQQKLTLKEKNEAWKKATLDYFIKYTLNTDSNNRSSNTRKLINYNLFNGIFDKKDLEYVCNPLGLSETDYPATLQHYDIISPYIMLLLGEEESRPDNFIVVSESKDVVNRKNEKLKKQILEYLEQQIAEVIQTPPGEEQKPIEPPTEILKYAKYNISDMIEIKANKILKVLKKKLNTKLLFAKGWKDTLLAGEEIYWTGIINNEPVLRRCNPVGITCVLDVDSDFIDDSIAVIETRYLSIPSILDEFGEHLTSKQISDLEDLARGRTYHTAYDISTQAFNNTNTMYNGMLRLDRVEWISMKKIGVYKHLDLETGDILEDIVDENFKLSKEEIQELESLGIETPIEWFWINEAWEGTRIGLDIYVNIQAKKNQRRRADNPYYCKLGYSGLIYNATNSTSTSLIDRLKPYQYLYNILMYRLELAFSQDMGKKFIMDVAQIPEQYGMDIEKWMYYMKTLGIVFINSFEESKKGTRVGQISNFNQFQSIDLSLAQSIQQYINSLEYIKQQVAFLSGITPQRLGSISTSELVGNTERAVNQSSLITEHWFEMHNEVKKRTYTNLLECAKVAYKDGKSVQYILDDLGIETLTLEPFEFDDEDFNVFMTNSRKDLKSLESLKQLFQTALQSDKATLFDIAKVLDSDSISEIKGMLGEVEQKREEMLQQQQQQQMQIEQEKNQLQEKLHTEQLQDKEADRQLKQYEIDQNNETKITVAQLAVYNRKEDIDFDKNNIADPQEIANNRLKQQELDSKHMREVLKTTYDNNYKNKTLDLKEKEMQNKKAVEELKLKQIETQNKSQEKINKESLKLKEKEISLKKQQLNKKK